jgi:hypothetical protein
MKYAINLLCSLSLLLLISGLVLWVRSHFVADAVSWNNGTRGWELVSDHGTIGFTSGNAMKVLPQTFPQGCTVRFGFLSLPSGIKIYTMTSRPAGPGWTFLIGGPIMAPMSPGTTAISPGVTLVQVAGPLWQRMGFNAGNADTVVNGSRVLWGWGLKTPYWLPCFLLAIFPAWQFYLSRKRIIRSQTGRCLTCGYDLRATANRCPECGTVTGTDGHHEAM